MKLKSISTAFLLLALIACSDSPPPANAESPAMADDASGNPFFSASTLPLGMPHFDRIEDAHFRPAIERGMAEQLSEAEAIAGNPDAPDFTNTIVALEQSGQLLNRVMRVFSNLAGADTNDERRAIQRETSPRLAAHQDAIRLNRALFARIDDLFERRDALQLDPESERLLARYHRDFIRAGARLTPSEQDRLRAMNAEMADLGTAFSQNVLQEVNDAAITVDTRAELAGLSDAEIRAAASAAAERGFEGRYLLPLQNYTNPPQLRALENRNVRQRLMAASLERGARGNDYDNRAIVSRMLVLRAERAGMLGYATHADYVLEEQTAGSIDVVMDMLDGLVPAALANARQEAADLQKLIDTTMDEPFTLTAADWAYFADKLRETRYAFNEAEIRPYFELDSVLHNGVFHAAGLLYGLTFNERPDLPVYHPDVRVFEVFDHDGELLAIFLADFYARGSKRGGAWMNSYAVQSELLGGRPVVANHQNIRKPPEGEPTLMTFGEVTTMFHEFGHALHGMFSDVTYPRFAATSVPRDFVEYPSKVNEIWAIEPSILANYALHFETGERLPEALLDRMITAERFNEGFRTTEYLAATAIDLCHHRLTPDEVPSADTLLEFEQACLTRAGIDFEPVPPRYRTPYFSHSMGGYAAGYYSYIWSEVLDADSARWFKENGGATRENGDHFRATILSRGGSRDAMTLYQDFTGREPRLGPLLERRGLDRER